MPLSPAPSALAVLTGFDGLLRCAPCRVRVSGVRAQLALNPLPSAFLLLPTLGFMPFSRLPPSPRSLDPFRRCYASNHKDREVAGRVFRCVPGHALPFEAFSLDSSRPVVTDGRYPLAVAGRCACRRRGCEPRRRLRWRLPTSRSCSAAEVRVHRSLSPAADAPMLPWASSWRGRVEDALAEATRTNRAEP